MICIKFRFFTTAYSPPPIPQEDPGSLEYDMNYIRPDVATICTGIAASFGAVILSSGTKGKRSCLPHSRIMIHQPSGGASGQLSDMEITYQLYKELQKDIYQILSQNTGQSYEQIGKDSDRDNWMRAKEAKNYGLIDEVLSRGFRD